MFSTKFVLFFLPIIIPMATSNWQPWRLIGLTILDLTSATTKRNSSKLDRKQGLNVLCKVCAFWADCKTTRTLTKSERTSQRYVTVFFGDDLDLQTLTPYCIAIFLSPCSIYVYNMKAVCQNILNLSYQHQSVDKV